MLDTIPAELLEKISVLSSTKDLKNVALCSRSYNNSLVPILYKSVDVPLTCATLLADSQDASLTNLLQNLKYTEQLGIGLPITNNYERMSVGVLNYAQILAHCDPLKLKVILFYNVLAEAISYAITLFPKTRIIGLKKCKLNDVTLNRVLDVETLQNL